MGNKKMTKTIAQTNFKARLLSGSSIAAVLAVGVVIGTNVATNVAHAANVNITGTAGGATAILTINTPQFATAGAFGSITTAGTNIVVSAMSVTESGTLYVNEAQANTLTMNTIAITSQKTLDVKLGFNTAGAAGALANTQLNITGNVTAAGGIMNVAVRDNLANTQTLDFTIGTVTLGTLTLTGGTGGSTATGSALTISDFAAAANITNLTFTGGSGGLSGGVGGAVILTTTTGVWTGSQLTFQGGQGGAGANNVLAAGGAGGAIGTSAVTAASIGNVTIASGNAGAAGNGGANIAGGAAGAGGAIAGMTVTGLVTGDLTITSGNASAGGIGSTSAVGGAGGAGGATIITNIVASTVGDVVITSGDGSNAGVGAVGFVGGVGANGGILTLTAFGGTGGTTSDVTVTSGSGGTGADGIDTASGAAGGAGGAVILTEISEATVIAGALSITAGDGAKGGDGSATKVGGVGGAGGLISLVESGIGNTGAVTFVTGSGAQGGSTAGVATGAVGGAGGAITATSMGNAAAAVSITTGSGGAGGASSAAQTGGDGGAGGAFTPGAADAHTIGAGLTIVAGDGGVGGASSLSTATGGAGGAGGAVIVAAVTGAITGNVSITGGTGGAGATSSAGTGGAGGVGGSVTYSTVGSISGTVFLDDGAAGAVGTATAGTAGAGGAAGTVTFTMATGTISGDVTVGDDGDSAIVTATGAVTFAGNVGTATKKLGTLTTGIATIFSKSLFTDSLVLGNTNAIAFNSTAGTVTGAITGTGDITQGANSVITYNNTIAARKFITNASSTSTFNGVVTLTGDASIKNGSTITLGDGIVAGDTLITYVGAASPLATGLTVNMPQNFTTGSVTFLDRTADVDTGAAEAIKLNTGLASNTLATYTAAATADGDGVVITATKKSTSAIATALGLSNQDAAAVSSSSDALATGDNEARAALNASLVEGGARATKAAATVGLQADSLGAGSSAAISGGGQVMGVASSRLASLRSAGSDQYASAAGVGFNTGGHSMNNAFWIKPFGTYMEQDTVAKIKGYDAQTIGLAAGADAPLTDDFRMGVSFAYSATDINGDGAGKSQTDIKSYQGTLYGDYTAPTYYVEGMVGYAMNNNDAQRTIDLGSVIRTAKGSYDSDQYMASIGAGMPMHLEGDTFFTPKVGLSYTKVKTDAYTETGAGNLNMVINPEDVDNATLSVGGRVHTKIKEGATMYTPEFRAGLSYDMIADEAVASGTFSGGGAAIVSKGAEVEELGGNVGVGVTVETDQAVSLSMNYDANVKDGFLGHSASLEARFKF